MQVKELICRTVGLAQSSSFDAKWRTKPEMRLANGMRATVRFQYLPEDFDDKQALRLNLRVDVKDLQRNADDVFDLMQHRIFDEEFRTQVCRRIHSSSTLSIQPVREILTCH